MRRLVPLVWACAYLAACGSADAPPDMADMGDDVKINGRPTGSIQTPSLCDREMLDARVSFGGIDSFAFAWANDHYEVVYSDLTTKDIYSVHLDDMGRFLDIPLAIDQTPDLSTLPALVPTPTGFAVAWQENDLSTPNIRTHALDLSGRPVGQAHVIAYGRSNEIRPVLSPSPQGVAISWMDQAPNSITPGDNVGDSTTYVGLLDDNLQLRSDVPPQRVTPTSRSGFPWLAGNGSTLNLLWSNNVDGVIDPYFAPIDLTSLSLDHSTDVRGATVTQAAQLGRMSITDFGFLTAWEDLRTGSEEIYMSLLDPSGNRYAGGLVEEPDTGNANWPHMAWTGSAAAVVYYQFRGGRPQIFLTFIDQNGQRIMGAADAQVSNTTASAKYPDVVWNGTGFAIMWIDTRDGQPELYFNRALCDKPAPI